MFSCPLSFKSVPQSSPHPHPIRSFPALEALRLQAGPRRPSAPFVPLLPIPTGVGSRSPVSSAPQLQHPRATLPHPATSASRPSLRTRIPGPGPIPAPHPPNSARLSPQGLRGRSTKGGAAAARLRMLLPPPPPSPPPSLLPPLPSTGPGALSQARLVRCPGARLSAPAFSPHPPTPSPVPTRLELPLLPRPPPLAPRDGHALSGGCCAGAAGLLKEPAAAIRRAPGSSLALLGPSPPCRRCPVAVAPQALR